MSSICRYVLAIMVGIMSGLCTWSWAEIAPTSEVSPTATPASGASNTATANKNVTVDFYNVPIQDVARALALQQNINILLAPDVSGMITIHLENVSFEEALRYILEGVHATFTKEGNTYRIMTQKAPATTAAIATETPYTASIDRGRLTLNAKNTDIKIILQDISVKSGLNLSFDESLRGSITANLNQVPLMDGLQTLLQNIGYELSTTDGITKIQRLSQTKKYLITSENDTISLSAQEAPLKDVLHDLSLKTGVSIVSSPYVNINISAVINNSDIETVIRLILLGTEFQYKKLGSIFVIGNGDDLKTHSLFFTNSKVIPLKYVRAETILPKIPASFPTANIQFLSDQNAIAVSGSDDLVLAVEQFLSKIDQPVPQIKVDVLIVEYELDANKNTGLSLQNLKGIGFSSAHTDLSIDPTQSTSLSFNYDVAESLSKAFKLNLQALIEDKKARVAANPSIWALNGHEATIDVVTEDRFREQRYNEATGRLEPLGVPHSIESGVKLKMLPWITGDHEINLEIEPEVSNTTGAVSPDELPQTTKRTAKTVLKIKNGHTIVIGGLIQTTYENTVKRLPVVGALPLVGAAFRNKARTEHRTELVFYITPTIADDAAPLTSFDRDGLINSTESPLTDSIATPEAPIQPEPQALPAFANNPSYPQPIQPRPKPMWTFQADTSEIGSVPRRRMPKEDWDSYVQRLEKQWPKPSLSEKDLNALPANGGYVTINSKADRLSQLNSWNRKVDRILKDEQTMIGEFNEQDIWKKSHSS